MPAPELDPVIHAATRLRIVTTLASLKPGDAIAFPRLRDLLDLTVGNLSTHLTKLEEAGYVEIDKVFEGKRPATYVKLTQTGWAAFERYLVSLNELLGGVS
jgi:DNA-binding MarR family transcriptional regulator